MPFSAIAALEVDRRVEVGEGVGGRRVGVVVGRNVDRLDRGDGAALGRGDALLQLAHLGGERRLVADGGGHAAEERRDFGAGLGEAEDVVDEEQRVGAGLVAEILGHGERREGDAQARARRLVHLAEDHHGLVDDPLAGVADLGLLHFEPEVVAFAGAFADAGEAASSRSGSGRGGRSVPG